jgi:hypothetical protein
VDSYLDDTRFWIDYGIGRRVCVWIENILGQDAALLGESHPQRSEVDRLMAALVRVGVVEARQLEQSLANR